MYEIVKDILVDSIQVGASQILITLDGKIMPLMKYLQDGGEVEPIQVIKIKPIRVWVKKTQILFLYRLEDGYHRYVAYKLLGRECIKARCEED